MTNASPYVRTTEVKCVDDKLLEAAAIWRKSLGDNGQLYYSNSSNSLIELTAFNNDRLTDVLDTAQFDDLKQQLQPLMRSDFKRELLQFKQNVIEQDKPLPQSDYLQMRHIEVPLNIYDDYLAWRERTIFDYVTGLPNIESFSAYHSSFSTLPGVMFVCGFSCDPAAYTANFTTDAYQDIVKQAGGKYIAGGEQGLYTKIYERYKG